MSTVHVTPVDDLIEHDSSGDGCPCGPTVEAVMRDDGSNGWLIIHHSLDGREVDEGRRLASQRDDLIAQGVDPADLLIPLRADDLDDLS